MQDLAHFFLVGKFKCVFTFSCLQEIQSFTKMQTFSRHCAISSTLSPKFRYSSNRVRFGSTETNSRRVMRFLLLKSIEDSFTTGEGGLKITSMWVVLHDRVDEERNLNQNCAAGRRVQQVTRAETCVLARCPLH